MIYFRWYLYIMSKGTADSFFFLKWEKCRNFLSPPEDVTNLRSRPEEHFSRLYFSGEVKVLNMPTLQILKSFTNKQK